MLGEMKLVLKSNFESLPSFETSFTQFTQYEQEDLALNVRGRNQIFYHNSGMPNSMRPFPIQNFMLLVMHLLMYSLHPVKSLCILQSVSSGLKLLNTFAHCYANEISDLGKSAYLNYVKNSSCRLLCINALLIHHIIFSTVSMNLVRN